MRVVIVGGGKVGAFIAAELVEAGHDVTVLERDPARCAHVVSGHASNKAAAAEWRVADGCEVDALVAAQLETADVVVAVTGDDEDNLVAALLSKVEFGVPRVIARINDPDNEWMFDESWGVDVAVSTPHLITGLVEGAVGVGSLVRILAFEGGRIRLSELTLAANASAVGRQLAELEFPRGASIVAIVRDDHVVVPRGDTALCAGDDVVVLVSDDTEPLVQELLTAG